MKVDSSNLVEYSLRVGERVKRIRQNGGNLQFKLFKTVEMHLLRFIGGVVNGTRFTCA